MATRYSKSSDMGGIGSGRKKFKSDSQRRLRKKKADRNRYLKNRVEFKEKKKRAIFFRSTLSQINNEIKNKDLIDLVKAGIAYRHRKVWKQLKYDLEWRYWLKTA